MPKLLAYASRLTGTRSAAEDIVQETVLRALLHADQFKPGTNLGGWLTVILRNCYFNERRAARRIEYGAPTPDDLFIHQPQEWHLSLGEVQRRLAKMPGRQQQAIALIAINGESYEEAARVAKCAVGTIKSRVSRARAELVESYSDARGARKETAA